MKQCPRCNRKLSDEASFCFVCGALEIEESLIDVISLPDSLQPTQKTTMFNIEERAEELKVIQDQQLAEPRALDVFIKAYSQVNLRNIAEINRFLKEWNCRRFEINHYDATVGTVDLVENEKGNFLLASINNSLQLVPTFLKTFSRKRRLMLDKCFVIEPGKIVANKNYLLIEPASVEVMIDNSLRLRNKGKIRVLLPHVKVYSEVKKDERTETEEENGAKEVEDTWRKERKEQEQKVLEKKLVAKIQKSPKGIKLYKLGEVLGVDFQFLLPLLEKLLKERKVTKAWGRYYPPFHLTDVIKGIFLFGVTTFVAFAAVCAIAIFIAIFMAALLT